MRTLRLLAGYIRRYFIEVMAWRSFLFTLVVNQAITPLIGLAVWSAALPGSPSLSTYYVALLAVQLMTVSYEHHTFSNGIYAGNLTEDLLRPHPVVLVTLGANLAIRVWHLLAGLPLIILAGTIAGASLDPGAALTALPAVVLAATLRFLFTYALALSAFWTERAHGVVGLGETLLFLLGGAAAPVTLFPQSLQPLGEALPFWAMLGFPAAIAAHRLSVAGIIEGYGWQLLWIATFAFAATLGWKSGVRRYTAVGG